MYSKIEKIKGCNEAISRRISYDNRNAECRKMEKRIEEIKFEPTKGNMPEYTPFLLWGMFSTVLMITTGVALFFIHMDNQIIESESVMNVERFLLGICITQIAASLLFFLGGRRTALKRHILHERQKYEELIRDELILLETRKNHLENAKSRFYDCARQYGIPFTSNVDAIIKIIDETQYF